VQAPFFKKGVAVWTSACAFSRHALPAAGTLQDEQQDMAQETRRGEEQAFFDPENLVL